MDINYRAEQPPHRQIAAWIIARIQDGTLAPGDPIPSEIDIQGEFGVARSTARRAVAWLRSEGWVRTVAGRGSYVSDRRPG